jgi:branched-chain amino acid transport system ATP-binding protein
MLDEPTAGMSVAETRALSGLIARVATELGLTLLFTEHDMSVVFGIADRITVLHHGQVIAEGSPEAVRGHPEVKNVYLGHGHAA